MIDQEGLDNLGIMQTRSGRVVNCFNLRVEDIVVEDIAHGLANIGRWQGQGKNFYSVGQHSVLLASYLDRHKEQVEPKVRVKRGFHALFHDASETYLGDIPAVFKAMPEFAFYLQAEHRAMCTIWTALGLGDWNDFDPVVQQLDRDIRGNEMDLLYDSHFRGGPGRARLPYLTISHAWHPCVAQENFLEMYDHLMKERASLCASSNQA